MKRIFSVLLLLPLLALAQTRVDPKMVKGPAGVGTMADHTSGWVNVRSYGAKGDGTTDDTAAIQAAIATGKPVFVPDGTFLVKAPIALPSGGTLRGNGRGTVVVVPDAGFVGERIVTNSDIAGGNTNIAISDFAIRVTAGTSGPVSGANPGILRFQNVDGLSIQRIYTETFSSQFAVLDFVGVSNAIVSGCRLKNANATTSGGGFWIRGGPDASFESHDVTVIGNVFEAVADEAFTVYAWAGKVYRVTATGNVITNTGATKPAFGVIGSDAGVVGTAYDIAATANTINGQSIIVTGASRVVFKGNTLTGPSGSRDALLVSTASGAAPSDIVVEGNVVNGAGRYGIYSNATDGRISGNAVYGTTSYGIYAVGGYVDANLVKGCGGVNIRAEGTKYVTRNVAIGSSVGISVFGALADAVISDNTVADATDTGIAINANTGAVSNLAVIGNVVRTSSGTNGIRAYNGGTWTACVLERNRVWGSTTRYAVPAAGWRKTGNTDTVSNTPWPAITGTNAQRPTASLGADDVGFQYRSSDAPGLLVWTGTGWVKSSDNSAVP